MDCGKVQKQWKNVEILQYPPQEPVAARPGPLWFPKSIQNVGKTYVLAMWDPVDVLLASSGACGHAWDLHEEPWKTLANPCFSVVGSATTGAAGRGAGQVDRES